MRIRVIWRAVVFGALSVVGTPLLGAQATKHDCPERDKAVTHIFTAYWTNKISADSTAKLFLDFADKCGAVSINVQMDSTLRAAIVKEQQRRAKR